MTLTKKRLIIFFATFFFIILYIFLCSPLSSDELQLIPTWTVSVTKAASEVAQTEELYPFKLGQNLGYFTKNGDIVNPVSFPYLATISNKAWTTYGSTANNTAVFDVKGEKVSSIIEAGFPFFTDCGDFLFFPGGMSVSEIDDEGKIVWQYEDIAPITAFSSFEDGCIVGFAHGKLIKFNKRGEEVFSVFPGGSEFQVVLGADAESTNSLSACVCGIDDQRVILFKTQGTQTKIIYHEYLQGNLREQTFVKFNDDGTKLFFNEYDGLGIIDCTTLQSFHIPLEGKILSMTELSDQNLFFVLCKTSDMFTVYIFEDFANLIGSYSYKANSSFIFAKDNALYNGKDLTITKIEVKK